jgi:hypothetical protein
VSEDNGWIPPERYAGERPDLESEARRLVALTREAAQRKEILERKLHDRLNGQPYVDAADWLARNDEQREQENGHAYPESWEALAALARQVPRKRIGRPPRKT